MFYTGIRGMLIFTISLKTVSSAFEFLTMNNIVLKATATVVVKERSHSPLMGNVSWTYVGNETSRRHIGTSKWNQNSRESSFNLRYSDANPLLIGQYLYIRATYNGKAITSNFTVFMYAPWGLSLIGTPTIGKSLELVCMIPEKSNDVTGMEWRRRDGERRREGFVMLRGSCAQNQVIDNWGYSVKCEEGEEMTNVSLIVPASKMDKSFNNSLWRCVEFNKRFGSRFVVLDVQEFPVVSIKSITAKESDSNVKLVCEATGHPSNYTYVWEHRINGQLIQTHQDLQGYLTSEGSELIIPSLTYQDAGDYICKVSNGVSNHDGNNWATAMGKINVSGSMIIPSLHSVYQTETGVNFTLRTPFYSNPKVTSSDIIMKNTDTFEILHNSPDLCITVDESEVDIRYYGQFTKLSGQAILIQFYNFTNAYYGSYLVIITNTEKRKSSFSFEIRGKQIIISDASTNKPIPSMYFVIAGIVMFAVSVFTIVILVSYKRRKRKIQTNKKINAFIHQGPERRTAGDTEDEDGYTCPKAVQAAGAESMAGYEMSIAENSHLWHASSHYMQTSTSMDCNTYEAIRDRDYEELFEPSHKK